MGFSAVPLGPDTWDGFADLVDRDDGILAQVGRRARVVGRHLEPAG